MASSINKSLCVTCNEKVAFFTCSGCRQDFCEDHINEEHQSPIKQINEFLTDHDELQENTRKYMEEPSTHPLIQQIDKWERQSISKIQEVADDARAKILNLINDHLIRVKKSIEILTQKIQQAQKNDKFTDKFLRQWRDKLDNIKNNLKTPETIQIHIDNDSTAFISKLTVRIIEPNDLFEQTAGNIRIEDDGQLVVHGQWSDHASVRGRNEYSDGQHRFRFKLEQLDSDKWAFFGIVSKQAPLKPISISTPTAYGLAGQNGICLNGIYKNADKIVYESDIEMNDVVELMMDCDHHLIRLTNERTHSSHELNIDINNCSFPWQILLGLCCSAGDRIRLLPCTYKEK